MSFILQAFNSSLDYPMVIQIKKCDSYESKYSYLHEPNCNGVTTKILSDGK